MELIKEQAHEMGLDFFIQNLEEVISVDTAIQIRYVKKADPDTGIISDMFQVLYVNKRRDVGRIVNYKSLDGFAEDIRELNQYLTNGLGQYDRE